MSKFLSGRLRQLLVGITGYTENKTVVQTTGKVGIGTTDAQQHSLYVVGSTNITGDNIVGGGLTAVGIGSFQNDVYIDNQLFVGGVNITGGASLGEDISARNLYLSGIATVTGLTELNGGLEVTGVSTFTDLIDANGGIDATSAKVEDLTNDRVVLAGVGGELEDSPNLTFDGNILNVVGHTETDTLQVSGISTFGNNVEITGDLTVTGTRTFLNTTELEVQDINIGIASADPKLSNAQLDGAGITIYGSAGDKTLTWSNANSRMEFNTDLFVPNIDIGGHAELDQLRVSGVSTFVGVSTQKSTLFTNQLNTAGVSTFNADVHFPDNISANFGTDIDLEIYHDGNANGVIDNNTGDLYIRNKANNSDVYLLTDNSSGGETIYVDCQGSTGSVGLRYYGTERLITKPYGVKVTGITSTQHLNVTGVSTFQDNVHLLDNDKLLIGGSVGTHDGLEIYHDSNHSYIDDSGTGNLYLRSGTLAIQNLAGSKTSALFQSGGGQELYHNNTKRLETTGYGVTIYNDLRVGTAVTIYGNAGIVSAISFYGDGSNLTNTGATLGATSGTERLVTTQLTSGTMVDAATDADLTFDATTNTLNTDNIKISGGISTNGSAYGQSGELLRSTGSGWEWANVPGLYSVNNILNGFNVLEEGATVGTAGSIHTLDFRGFNVTASADPQPNGIATVTFSTTPTFDSVTINGDLDVDGRTELDITNISETLNVVGIATFASDVDIDGDLDVDGHTELDQLNVSGVSTFVGAITAGTAYFGGNVTIGGTLTYEDVSNIDSVGVITARDGLIVSGVSTFNGLVDINAGGQADTFKVEDLTENRIVIVGPGGELEDDANLTFDGAQLNVGAGLTVTGISTFSGEIDANGRIVAAATNNVIPFLYSNLGDLPSAVSFHGAFAHVHGTGKAYYAHASNWYELVNKDLNGTVGTGTETYNIANINITGITTLGGTVTAGGTTGTNGQYLQSTGVGVTWASFPTLRVVGVNTATAGQTAFNFVYNADFLDVFVNGVKLSPSEYTATNGNQIVLNTPAFADEIVEFHSYNTVSTGSGGGGGGGGGASLLGNLNDVTINTLVDDQLLQYNSISGQWENVTAATIVGAASSFATKNVTRTTATANQTTFNGTYTVGYVDVYFNGAKLSEDQYTATTGTNIVLNAGASVNDIIEVVGLTANIAGSSYGDSHVDLHLNTSTASSGEILSWNGSDYEWVADQIGSVGAGGTWATDDVGINTTKSIGIGTTAKDGYKLYVEGDARVTGILTVGPASVTIDGINNEVIVGSGITLYGNTGIISATSLNVTGALNGDGSSLTGLTGAAANTYGNGTAVPQITVDANGRITGISNVLISGSGGGGSSIIVQNSQSLVGAAGTIDFGSGLSVTPVSVGIVTVTADFDLTDLSVTTASAGSAALSYNNSNGVFTYTPPDLSSYLTSYTETDPVVAAVNGIVKSNGSTISAATAGTDYLTPGGEFTSQWTFTASDSSNYQVTGPGFAANSTDPTIYVMRGHKYKFTNNAGSHPLQIQYEFENASGTAYTDGITNSNNVITWEVRNDTPDLLHYQCTSHGNMSGRIVVLGDVVTNGSWTASAGTPQTIDTITGVANNDIKTAEYTIHIENGSNMQAQKVLVMQDGTTAYSQEYGIMHKSGLLVSMSATISGGNLLLQATPEAGVTGTTTYKVTRQTMR